MTDMPEVSWSEVGLGEIAIDLFQARFWITSGWPTNQKQTNLHW
jgi:hypothetical protein